jgi:hypothetical protein
MADEKIEVGYRHLGTEIGVDYHHKFLLYTDQFGHQYTISGWSDEAHKTADFPLGKMQIQTNLPYDANNPDHLDNGNTYFRDAMGRPVARQEQYRETIIEAPDLSAKWAEMVTNAQTKDNLYPYDAIRQNSNTLADAVLREAGLPEPKLDGISKHLSPASGKELDEKLIPRTQEYLKEHKIGTAFDAISLNDTNKQDPLNQPLAVNASVQEVGNYTLAALLLDDDDAMHAALDKAFATDVAKDTMQNAQQAVIAYDNEQAKIQQIESPVRVMRMG